MRSHKSHQIQVRHLDRDELVTELVPEGGGATRVLSFLVSVDHIAGSYNFCVPMPKGGAPKHLLLEGRLLEFVKIDHSHPHCPVYEYTELKITAMAVRDATPVTYPEREGPARPMFEWDHPE